MLTNTPIVPEWETSSGVMFFYYYPKVGDFELPKVTNIASLGGMTHMFYVLPESMLYSASLCDSDTCTSDHALNYFTQ